MKGRFEIDFGLINFVNRLGARETEKELKSALRDLPISYETNEVKPKDEITFRVDPDETAAITKNNKMGAKTKINEYPLIPSEPISVYENSTGDPRVRFVDAFKDSVTVEFQGRYFSLHYQPTQK